MGGDHHDDCGSGIADRLIPWLVITMMIVAEELQTDITPWVGITMMIVVVGL